MTSRVHLALVTFLLIATSAFAKDQPIQQVMWPDNGTPVLKFSFGKFKEVGSVGSQRTYQTDTTAENLAEKLIPNTNLFVYLFDKNKVRIGEGWITLTNVGPHEVVRFQTTFTSSGAPVTIALEQRAPRSVEMTINSSPQGASLRVDGKDSGVTPKVVQVGLGKHILEFSKDGFNTGHFPLDIGTNDASGGSVTYELGTSAHDTIELRDGSVLSGDLETVSATDVAIRVGGEVQHFNRNQVKRILLVERDAPTQ